MKSQRVIKISRVHYAGSFFQRLQGLMFKKTFPSDYDALAIIPCNAIHTFFMRFNIDVLFLNQKKQVVALRSAMEPWRFSPRIKDAHFVIELPVGAIKKYEVTDGVHIEMEGI